MAGNEMCYLGEMLGGYGLVFTPISALRSNFNTALYCRSCQRATCWRGDGAGERGGQADGLREERKMSKRLIEGGHGKLWRKEKWRINKRGE